ncbi:hypothetical protein [Actinophytocola sp. NPDC049390]|uniref:hypothetical protein n=1 Tax=Actinophytocola sp. NPDC049390 TaxID=3363894 RepID=UPI0037951B62
MGKQMAVLGGLVAVLVVALVVLLTLADPSADLALEGAKTAMNLIVAVLITGVLSAVLAQRATNRAAAEDRKVVLTGALRNLKAGYEQAQQARFFLAASTTAATFIEQIPRLAEARSALHLVQRERYLVGTEIDGRVQAMLDYMSDLTDEYRENYPVLAEAALREERARRRFVEGAVDVLPEPPALSATLFPKVTEFARSPEHWRQSTFHQSYRMAKRQLQDSLTRP